MSKSKSHTRPHSPHGDARAPIEAYADQLLQALPSPVMVLDLNGRIVFVNHSAQRLFEKDVTGSELTALAVPADRSLLDSYLSSLRGITETGASRYTTFGICREDAKPQRIAVTGAPVRHADRPELLLSLTDITLQQEREAELQMMAMTDSLTRLPNRRSFLISLREAIADGHGCVVALADMDRFKDVNDKFGHTVGDLILCAAASRMVASLPANAVVARLGGDEFAVLIPGDVDDNSLRQLESLRHIELPNDIHPGGPSSVSLSIGVTHTTAGDENDVLRQSDVAMYAAKDGGRANVAVYGDEAAAIVQQSQSITLLVESLRRQNERLHLEARTDARTGLANSRALSEVECQSVGTPNSEWAACGVIFVDIDHFGAFNHLYGDHAGDEALKRVADALRLAGRKTDLVFRKGGEEFVMVLPRAEPDAIARVARHLAETIADLKIPHAEGPTGWLSALIVGVSALPQETVGSAVMRAGNAAMRCKLTDVRAQVVLTQ